MNLRCFSILLSLSLLLGASVPDKEYMIEGDRCTFGKDCTKHFDVTISDVRQVSKVGVDKTKDGKPIRGYFAHCMQLIKFKNNEKLYSPVFHRTSVEPGTGFLHDTMQDLYTNIYMEQCKRHLPVHHDIEKYVFVLYPTEEPKLGWRVVKIAADPKSDVIELGDLAKATPLDDYQQRKQIVGFFKEIKGLPDLSKIPIPE